MPTKYLTDKAVKSIRTLKGQEDFWDQGFTLRGIRLGLRVYRSGSREYICRYRYEGKRRFLSLGDAKVVLLSEARSKVASIKESLESGIDPALEKAKRLEMPTVRDLCELYLAQYANRKKDGGKSDRQTIQRDVLPRWGELKVVDIRRRDIIDLLEFITNIRKAPISSNRTRALLSRLFSFALERELIEQTPCAGLGEKNPENLRQRVLSDSEISRLWNNLHHFEPIYSNITKLLLLTAQRPSEVCGMRWSEINGENWILPSERTKNGRSHLVPLTPQALAILSEANQANSGKSEYVFPADLHRPVRSRTYLRFIQRVCLALEIPSFKPHDLRRTARTNFSKLRIEEDVRERILNHVPLRLHRTYDVYDYILEKREALTRWDRRIITISSGPQSTKALQLFSAVKVA